MRDSEIETTDEYSIKVKNGAGWRDFNVARMHISVGQSKHEGKKLRAALDWASENFERVIICVNDTLQRHNIEFQGKKPDAAMAFSEAAGREWIERNLHVVRKLPRFELIRWESWRAHQDYSAHLRRMEALYDTEPSFRLEVDSEIRSFWHRRGNELPGSFEDFEKFSKRYLLEECAAFQIMYERDAAADVYPGTTLLPTTAQAVLSPDRSRFTRIDFRRQQRIRAAG